MLLSCQAKPNLGLQCLRSFLAICATTTFNEPEMALSGLVGTLMESASGSLQSYRLSVEPDTSSTLTELFPPATPNSQTNPAGRTRVRLDARNGRRGRLLLLLGLHRHPNPRRLPRCQVSCQQSLRLGHSNQRLPQHAAPDRGQSWIPVRDDAAHPPRPSRGEYLLLISGHCSLLFTLATV